MFLRDKSTIFLIILALILMAGGVWYVWKPAPTPSPTVDKTDNGATGGGVDTKDWVKYKNDEFGYEFSYPKDKVEIVLNDIFERGTQGNPSFRIKSGGHFALGVWDNSNNITIKEWLDNNDIGIQYDPKEIHIGDITAYSAINSAYVDTCHIEWIVIPKLKKLYTFGVEICGESKVDSLKLFYAIVNKFKFLI